MTFNEAIHLAKKETFREDLEEAGGFILKDQNSDDFVWLFIPNDLSGTKEAPTLYSANRREYTKKTVPLFMKGYRLFASFHTHPAFSATPSWVDTKSLFKSFKNNIIYSVKDNQTVMYSRNSTGDLTGEEIHENL